MARLTMVFGSLLIVIALIGFIATGHAHPTALIPAAFGLALVLSGAAANTPVEKKRALWMHIAVTVGLLGFLSTATAIYHWVQMLRGVAVARPAAVEEKAAMSIICLIFVLLCVRSFITARRSRKGLPA